jgi:hypothetical protein
MANREHLAILKEGVEGWNQWRQRHLRVIPNLAYADLVETELSGADLSATDLREAGLIGAHLRWANLSRANLGGADLRAARLYEADLAGAFLGGANLRLTDLTRADFTGADLTRANLTLARVGYTIFVNVKLSGVEGLGTIKHIGPSSISIDTIYESMCEIPPAFLRGAGVPENLIEFLATQTGAGIGVRSLFISYSTKDQEFAEHLHTDLQAKGVRCWFAPHDIRGGRKIHVQIDEAIRVFDKLLLILSGHSMKSEWVKTEISKARKREIKEGRQVLFPIRLCSIEELRDWECFDADTGKDSAREIREYFIPDFSSWKNHDVYRIAFDRLLKDLQGKGDPTSA